MLTPHDKWLLPPEPRIPELEDEARLRILLDILWFSFRQKIAVATIPEHTWREWMDRELIQDGAVFDALIAEHREAIEERWAEEHLNP